MNSPQIKEETEESSEDDRKNKSSILKETQLLDVLVRQRDDTLIIMHKGSEDSRSTTPPLSANAYFVNHPSPPEESKNNI